MTAPTILGVDPGAHGAIAVLEEGRNLLEVLDMRTTPEANSRTVTNPSLLARILTRTHARIAFCEFIAARPTDASASAFQFARARGCVEAVCGALGLPIVF
jgi:hypothetical protein